MFHALFLFLIFNLLSELFIDSTLIYSFIIRKKELLWLNTHKSHNHYIVKNKFAEMSVGSLQFNKDRADLTIPLFLNILEIKT